MLKDSKGTFIVFLFIPFFVREKMVELCVGRESNPSQLLGRQLCLPIYHRLFIFFIYFVCAMLPVFKASAYVFFRESTTCTSRRTCSVTRTSWAWSPLRRSWSPSPPSSTPRTPRGWSRSGSYRSYVFIFTNVGGFPLPPPNLVSL